MTKKDQFADRRAVFDAALEHLALTSDRIAGRFVEPRFGWATWIFARMGITAHSIQVLLRAYVDDRVHTGFDHFSIIALCRTIVEQHVFLAYLTEPGMSKEEWDLRKWTLDIHDCASRVRLFRSLGDEAQKKAHQDTLPELRDRIRTNALFNALPEQAKAKILSGESIYVRGFRAAVAAANWDKKFWDGIYNYLSAPLHASPLSFYRLEEAGAHTKSITPYQLTAIAFALDIAHLALKQATDRMMELFPDAVAPDR